MIYHARPDDNTFSINLVVHCGYSDVHINRIVISKMCCIFPRLNYLLILIIIVISSRSSDAVCNTFRNTTITTTINSEEFTKIFDDCNMNPSIEKIIIKSCVETVEEGTFKDLPNLTELTMTGINIKEIQPDFIQNLPKLDFITITNNLFTKIRKGVFSNLKANMIDLENNKVSRIQRAAFENLDADILSLNNNSLRSIENGWFKNSSINNLQICANKITWLGKNTFDGIKNLELLDLLDNGISYIQDGTFSQLTLSQLDLSENMLTETTFLLNTQIKYVHIGMNLVSHMFLNNSADIKSMTIYPNPWRCECLRKFWVYTNAKSIVLREPPRYVKWKDEFAICIVLTTDCTQNAGDQARNDYFKKISFTKLQYTSIFD